MSVHLTSDLRLECDIAKCKDAEWCDHKSKYISGNLESKDLFAAFDVSPDSVDTLCPLLPTKNLWAPVRLKPAGRAIAISSPNDTTLVYGVISEGEGFSTIRTLWFDFFETFMAGSDNIDEVNSKVNLLRCDAPKHGWKAKKAASLVEGNIHTLEYNLNVYLTGQCPTCNLAENYEDLFEDAAQTPMPSAWKKAAAKQMAAYTTSRVEWP